MMHTLFEKAILAMLVFVGCTRSYGQELLANEEPIRSVNEIYTKAVGAGDTLALKTIMADHLVITGGNGVQRNRSAEFKDLVIPGYKVHFFQLEDERYFRYEHSAIVTGQLHWKMTTSNGEEMELRRVFTFSYSKFGDHWKMIAQHIGRAPK